MKQKGIRISVFFLLSYNCVFGQPFSQIDSMLNRFDGEGKKDEFWERYLDRDFKRVRKNRDKTLYRYLVWFENGIELPPPIRAPYCSITFRKDGNYTECSEEVITLNGVYFTVSRVDSTLLQKSVFSNGNLQYLETYFRNGNISTIDDFKNKYCGINSSYSHVEYNIHGVIDIDAYAVIIEGKWRIIIK